MLLSVDGAVGTAEDFAACRGDAATLPAAAARARSHRLHFLHVRHDRPAEGRRDHAPHDRTPHCLAVDAGRAAARHAQPHARHGANQPRDRLLRHVPRHARLQRHVLHHVGFQSGRRERPDRAQQNHLSVLRAHALSGDGLRAELQARAHGFARARAVWRRADLAGAARSHRSRVAGDRAPYLRHDRNHVRAPPSRAGRTAGDACAPATIRACAWCGTAAPRTTSSNQAKQAS